MNAPKGTELLTLPDADVLEWLNSFDTVLFDCDGVLWVFNDPIEGSPETVKKLQAIGKKVFFVTNNSTRTRDDFTVKSKSLNYFVEENDIISTAYLAATYLKKLDFKKKVYVIGTPAIKKELEFVGIPSIGYGPDPVKGTVQQFLTEELQEQDPEVGAVIVGFDEHFSFAKMMRATTYLENKDCIFIGTNSDQRFPMPNGVIPGTGSLIKTIETATERDAIMMGKPSNIMCDVLIKGYNVNPKRTLMVGDRCNTDILFGQKCGFKTLMVETGIHKKADVDRWIKNTSIEDKLLVPDFILPRLGKLLKYLK